MMSAETQKQSNHAIGILFLAVFIDLLGFGIIIPILPIWTTSKSFLGQSDFMYGLLVASYSFAQFLCAPLWGKLSDRKGRKPIIMIGLTGSVIGFSLLTLAFTVFQDIQMLFIARIVSGMFTAATLPTSQAFLTDSTEEKDRAKAFGLIGAAFGLGFTLGPGLGAVLALFGQALPALAATILAIINLSWAIFELPESLTDEVKAKRQKAKDAELSKTDVFNLFKQKRTIPVIMIMFSVLTFAFVGMETTIILLGFKRFQMTDSQGGLVLLVAGVVAIITQGGIIRPLSKKYQDEYLTLAGLIFLIIGFLGLTTAYTLTEIMFWVIPLSFGSSIGTPTLISLLSKDAPETQSGEILGLNSGAGSFMRVIGPLVATALFTFDPAYPYFFSALLLVIVFIIGIYLISMLGKYKNIHPLVNCSHCGHDLVFGDEICQYCGQAVN